MSALPTWGCIHVSAGVAGYLEKGEELGKGLEGVALPHFEEALLAPTRHSGGTKAHESLLNAWSPTWGGIREAARGLGSPDVTPEECGCRALGFPGRNVPPGAGSRASETPSRFLQNLG